MPFTLFHLGPALAIGLPLRKFIHTPTFIIANIILDLEPFFVLLFSLDYPLHGYLHTIVAAVLISLILGSVLYRFDFIFNNFWHKTFLTTVNSSKRFEFFILANLLGSILHVLLDAPLYSDIKPFYPLTINPLYYPQIASEIYNACLGLGVIGIIYYIYLIKNSKIIFNQKIVYALTIFDHKKVIGRKNKSSSLSCTFM
jgi:hypothetical protein